MVNFHTSTSPSPHAKVTEILCFFRLESSHTPTVIQALKLMVNLACCPDVIAYFLVAKAPQSLKSLFNATQDNDILLRSTIFLLHVCSTVDTLGLAINVGLETHVGPETNNLPATVDALGPEMDAQGPDVDAQGLEMNDLPSNLYKIPASKTIFAAIFGPRCFGEWLEMMAILQKNQNLEIVATAKRCENVLKRLKNN